MANNIFGDRINELLQHYHLTQKELAEQIGITEASMSRYITGARIPKANIIANIATALHTTSDYLLGTEQPDDFETEYYKIHRLIARNAAHMSGKQKNELIRALLDDTI